MTPRERAKQLLDSGNATVTPKEAAEVLKCKPYSLNVAAKLGRLTIPHFFAGNRLKISTEGLYNFVIGTNIDYARPQWLARGDGYSETLYTRY